MAVIFSMRLKKTVFVLVLVALISCARNDRDSLFVFVGKQIPSGIIEKRLTKYFKLKYQILQKTYGSYQGDTIDFLAYSDADSLEFTKYETVFLFLYKMNGQYYKLVMPWYHVYQTVDGRWASGAKWWEYGDIYPTSIEPRRLQFKDSVYFDLKGMSQEQIDHWYPAKYYERKGDKARPVFGSYTDELFEIQKNGFLRDAKFF